ncbi:hypothetical protein E2C01_036033 [Portunus trituberculatus]|uniref:Uncharacterized protein n=1 Tax=Portunus trituberculatus TaxID=210409 RepID=A0A5B7F7K7_PORTR|nr:hypothetical protein [Portunus trituberculatus]
MVGVSARRSGIRVWCCTSYSRSWRIATLKSSSRGWSSEGRGKPKLVVNIKILKNGIHCERVEGQNVFHFGN